MNGMGWVIGALMLVIAIAFVIAGGSGHAQNLFGVVFGKSTSGTALSAGGTASELEQGAQLTSAQAIDNTLTSLQAQPSGSSTPGLSSLPGVQA